MADRNPRVAYGLNEALMGIAPQPIVSNRNPTANDRAPIGQTWVNKTTNTAFTLTSIAANASVWATGPTAVAGNQVVAGTITAGTGLTVTAGGATITAGGLTVTAGGAAITGLTAVTGAITATTTITAGTGIVATTGGVTATAGGITATAGNIVATAGNISTTAGSITSATTITATLGNITATNGNFICTTVGSGISLPGGVRIITGAGAPAAVVPDGSMYLRNDPGAFHNTCLYLRVNGAWEVVTSA